MRGTFIQNRYSKHKNSLYTTVCDSYARHSHSFGFFVASSLCSFVAAYMLAWCPQHTKHRRIGSSVASLVRGTGASSWEKTLQQRELGQTLLANGVVSAATTRHGNNGNCGQVDKCHYISCKNHNKNVYDIMATASAFAAVAVACRFLLNFDTRARHASSG